MFGLDGGWQMPNHRERRLRGYKARSIEGRAAFVCTGTRPGMVPRPAAADRIIGETHPENTDVHSLPSHRSDSRVTRRPHRGSGLKSATCVDIDLARLVAAQRWLLIILTVNALAQGQKRLSR